jgi:hypothetical protein
MHIIWSARPDAVNICLKKLSGEIGWAESGIIRKISYKGKAPRFATGFDHPLSYERPFKFQRHLIQDLECNKLISTVHTSGSGLF